MNTLSLAAALLLPALCVASSPEAEAWIDHERLPGTQSQAMGGAMVALAEDWSAAWYNPAGLALLKRTEFNLGFEGGSADERRSVSSDGREQGVETSTSSLSHAGYAHPLPALRGGLCWAVGWARLADFAQGSAFPDGNWRVTQTGAGTAGAWLLALGGQLTTNLAGGATLALHSQRQERLDQEENLGDGTFWRSVDTADLDGVSLRLGLLAHQGPLRVGLLLEPAHSLNVDWSHYEQEGDLGADPAPVNRWGSNYGLRMPALASVGAGWRTRFWQAGLNWDWQDWAALRYEDLPAGMELVLSDQRLSQAFQSRSRLRIGGEWTVPGTDLRLRAGAWRESPARSAARLTDYDDTDTAYQYWDYQDTGPRQGLAGGISWLLQEVVALDISAARETWSRRWLEFAQGAQESVIRQRMTHWRFQLAMTYRI